VTWPLVLLVPSRAAGLELPRRLASTGRAVAGLYPMTLMDLARAVAEPVLLGRGLQPWDTGHDALLAARLLDGPHGLRLDPQMPRAPVARTLARTLRSLRMAGALPEALDALAGRAAAGSEDSARLHAVASLYRSFHDSVEGRFADPATLLRTARAHLAEARWLQGGQILIVDDLELEPEERELVAALAAAVPVSILRRPRPPRLRESTLAGWGGSHGVAEVAWGDTVLGQVAPPPPPPGLQRLRARLFEPPDGEPAWDGVELATAPGEAAEVRAIVRRLLREARRGVPFEQMGVLLPQPREYAPLFTDLLERLGIPFRLHPSLPLGSGRSARSLLLLLRCRGLARAAVMEFLTFAPVPFADILGTETAPSPAQWDALSRDAGVVSGLERWIIGLRSYAESAREEAARETDADRRERSLRRATDSDALLRVVELLSSTLEALEGEATWAEWAGRLRVALDQWVGRGPDRQVVADVLADLAGLASVGGRAPWRDVEQVLEARFEWERLPLDAVAQGAVHLGALDALAGLPFRVVAVPGLVEGGYPGVLRPDPFLLDAERESLADPPAAAPRAVAGRSRQLSLFPAEAASPAMARLETTQDRLLEARRLFHRGVSQATEALVLSYPRADPRTGRERMPSLFFVAAAATLEGRPLGAAELAGRVTEDALETLGVEDALDASERDRIRIRENGGEAALAIAAGSAFFKHSHLASQARRSGRFTAYDGLVNRLPEDLAARLDPIRASWAVSASRLATYSRCGFLYLLQYVLRLDPALEPEERMRLDPLERGDLFHRVAERFLREQRDLGALPVRDTPEARRRLLEMAAQGLDRLVAGTPPRFTVLWERERQRFQETMLKWLEREAGLTRAVPAHFEVSFGPSRERAEGEPHSEEPLLIDLGDGRQLRVSGKIDRIDRLQDGSLSLRDYKTGKAPRDDGGTFRGGKQLQIPFYVLAAARLFPDHPVTEAFLDYVDGGRRVSFRPSLVHEEPFRKLLRDLVDSIAGGRFLQEPTSCDWCDYKVVCGPRPLLERRRAFKIRDENVQAVLRLRDVV
jgi:ATP-dependent helicase/nuclease subunit B